MKQGETTVDAASPTAAAPSDQIKIAQTVSGVVQEDPIHEHTPKVKKSNTRKPTTSKRKTAAKQVSPHRESTSPVSPRSTNKKYRSIRKQQIQEKNDMNQE